MRFDLGGRRVSVVGAARDGCVNANGWSWREKGVILYGERAVVSFDGIERESRLFVDVVCRVHF